MECLPKLGRKIELVVCSYALTHACAILLDLFSERSQINEQVVLWILRNIPDLYGCNDMLQLSCQSGYFLVAQWLVKRYANALQDVKMQHIPAFIRACGSGHLKLAQLLVSRFKLSEADVKADQNAAFQISCSRGHLSMAQWLVNTFHYTRKDITSCENMALRSSCSHGHLKMVQWLVTSLKLTTADIIKARVDRLAYTHEQYDVIRWLVIFFELPRDSLKFLVRDIYVDSNTAIWMIKEFELVVTDLKSTGVRMLRNFCERNDLAAIRWTVDTFELTSMNVADKDKYAICTDLPCLQDSVTKQWLQSTLGLPHDFLITGHISALANICGVGDLVAAKKLILELDLKRNDVTFSLSEALQSACKNGHLEMAQFLVSYFGLTAKDVRLQCNLAFLYACKQGHILVAQWLALVFNMTVEDLRSHAIPVFADSCANGHLKLAEWFKSYFKLEAKDAWNALWLACQNGYLEVAQWVATEFKLTAKSYHIFESLKGACRNGHLHVVRWLVQTFNLTIQDVRSSFALKSSCVKGHLAVSQYLVSRFGLSIEDVAEDVFAEVCSQGYQKMAQWLVSTFKLTKKYVAFDKYRAFRMLCASYYFDVAQWLVSEFKLAADDIRSISTLLSQDLQSLPHIKDRDELEKSTRIYLRVEDAISNDVPTQARQYCRRDILWWLEAKFDLCVRIKNFYF